MKRTWKWVNSLKVKKGTKVRLFLWIQTLINIMIGAVLWLLVWVDCFCRE